MCIRDAEKYAINTLKMRTAFRPMSSLKVHSQIATNQTPKF